MVTTDKVTVAEFFPHIGKTTTDYKENDMGVKEILDRLYAYKNGTEDENLIDDVIQLIIDLDRLSWKAPSGATWNVGASNGWRGE